MLRQIIIAFVVVAASCGEATTPPTTSTPPVTTPSPPAPSPPQEEPMPATPVVASHVVCSWGSVGPSVPGSEPSWVIGMFDLRAIGEVRGLHLERIELLDGEDRPVTTATAELELRRAPPGRSQQDFSRYDTQDFDGFVPAGQTVRLWMHGRLDLDFTEIMSRTPARYRATLVTAEGAPVIVEGPLDPPWPTA